jgi:hypothetical protein
MVKGMFNVSHCRWYGSFFFVCDRMGSIAFNLGATRASGVGMRTNDSSTSSVAPLIERRRQVSDRGRRGMTQKEMSAFCGTGTATIGKLDRSFKKGGWTSAQVDEHGRPQGTGRMLADEQEREPRKVISGSTPDQLKPTRAVHAREAVRVKLNICKSGVLRTERALVIMRSAS